MEQDETLEPVNVLADLFLRLVEIGFGSDEDISGGDLVELMGEYFEKIGESITYYEERKNAH